MEVEVVGNFSGYEKRWGEGAVDLSVPSLPSLKVGWIAERLPQDKISILDYGCGEGKLLNTLALQQPQYKLFGTDIQPPKSSRLAFPFFLKKSDTEPLFENQKFDVVVSVDVLEHVDFIPTSLQQIKKQLKDDGSLFLFIPAEGQSISFYNIFRFFLGKDLYKKTKDHTPYSRKKLIQLIQTEYQIVELNYAYHIFGSLMDSTFFAACAIPAVEKWWWTKNSIYRPDEKKGLASRVLELANAFCFWESKFLRKVAFGSSGILVHAKKKH